MTKQDAIKILRALFNAGPVKLVLNTPDIAAGEMAIQTLEKEVEGMERAITNPNE